jgi:FkbM family methyltransferase
MGKVSMAARLIGASDDITSRRRLAAYFAKSAVRRMHERESALAGEELRFSLGGIEWAVIPESSHIGGIHDVWLAGEYDAFDGFRARPGSSVLDIGANIGAYTLWQWVNAEKKARVLAVEGAPATAAILRANVQRNMAANGVEVRECAVWSSAGPLEYLASARSSSTSGVAETLDRSLVKGAELVTVTAVTLGDLLATPALTGRKIDVAKIDVEGAEFEILKGASEGELRSIDRFVIEVDGRTAASVTERLVDAGFEFVGQARSVVYFQRRD